MEPITVAVTGVTIVDKLVLRFSTQLPQTGIAFRDYERLDAEAKKLVDETEPDTNANGKPKAKFAREYQVHFEDVENGRKYLYDVKIRTFENGGVWSMYKPLLESIGPQVEKEFDIEKYFEVGAMFTVKLTKPEGQKYWRMNIDTLQRA